LDVEPLQIVAAFDRITREGKRVKYHYVIVDYACRLKGGRLKPASDVVDARWVRREEMPQYHLTEMATKVILKSFEFFERVVMGLRPTRGKENLRRRPREKLALSLPKGGGPHQVDSRLRGNDEQGLIFSRKKTR